MAFFNASPKRTTRNVCVLFCDVSRKIVSFLFNVHIMIKLEARCVRKKFQPPGSKIVVTGDTAGGACCDFLTRVAGIFYGHTEPGFVFIIRLSKDDFQFITDTVFTKTLFSSSFTIRSLPPKGSC